MSLVRALGHRRWFAALGARVAHRIDRLAFQRTGSLATGRIFPTLLLTTIGRTSGRPRTTPLLYIRDGPRLVVASSNWGRPTEPGWARNLEADPHARVRIGGDEAEYRARAATLEERATFWPQLDQVWPAYATYRRRSRREVTLFVLER